ncbi:hypothetical protein NQ318_017611 [Aromia moschata]|uniref:RRM domain-containing protein n=1 Tax=Aromia moschata TaxID=1265417 RepID=A0AAV8Z3N5_9CUCU|nr:hypothetical protein NQ318_017611 [Aromia moschata]
MTNEAVMANDSAHFLSDALVKATWTTIRSIQPTFGLRLAEPRNDDGDIVSFVPFGVRIFGDFGMMELWRYLKFKGNGVLSGFASDLDTVQRILLQNFNTPTETVFFQEPSTCGDTEDKFGQLKQFMTDLVETKLVALEEKLSIMDKRDSCASFEEVVSEAMERIKRSNNVIICKVPESSPDTDNTIVAEILADVRGPDHAKPLWVRRIGKRRANASRMIKVSFSNPDAARSVLRKKNLAGSRFSQYIIRDDQTPKQEEHLKKLHEELEQRQESGENDITIRYLSL